MKKGILLQRGKYERRTSRQGAVYRPSAGYRELIPFALYFILYLLWFGWLEERHVRKYQVIHVFLDDYIPFCEWFIIPYLLWFLYVPAAVLYAAFRSRDEYIRSAMFLCTGMTVFLLVSTFFPNIQHLRPAVMPRDNALTRLVSLLERMDTPTNLWPSIHVYNSIGSHIAISRCLRENKRTVRACSFVLCVSIILSTMFLKQHSVFDVVTAFVLAGAMYGILYRHDLPAVIRQREKKSYVRNS
ncbi:MAG TPA: phosphatase PAP2 family protein [Candidatus Eisenbergiella merdipullorum]|uniref:Phosphatase PAP2 family protein n=1 Tax=Candidatus Eisenbergiella merdipullorum TaxID=2838553 RepID=A0A9D2I5M2_9FIRM|nr:phosphatase PAP2 family protein [Candidatus Eisenbergiella merdipullorum]